MKRLHVALITGLMIFSLVGCGKEDTGIIIGAGDNSSNISTNIIVESQTEENEEEMGEIAINNTDKVEIEQSEEKEINLLGIWGPKDITDNKIYTFDNENQFSFYNGDTNTYSYGTYDTDNKTYVEISILKESDIDQDENTEKGGTNTDQEEEIENTTEIEDEGYMEELGDTNEVEQNATEELETIKYSLEYSTYENEYDQTFESVILKNKKETIQLIKTVDIEEKTPEQIEKENSDNVEETTEE